ncbi:10629_t:CDS:2 [Paraglomus occultum]|uniref:10629_t:CDS:1 n=1 Tax=Paraglomus occultum TaxID=144539 RepID=A0A9N9B0T8_9GLOM|nr:10629_t:CDS:2 [Paraglomus occultum]
MNNSQSPTLCRCGIAAAFRQVRKTGPNEGRFFWNCSRVNATRCDFFKWAVEDSALSTSDDYKSDDENEERRSLLGKRRKEEAFWMNKEEEIRSKRQRKGYDSQPDKIITTPGSNAASTHESDTIHATKYMLTPSTPTSFVISSPISPTPISIPLYAQSVQESFVDKAGEEIISMLRNYLAKQERVANGYKLARDESREKLKNVKREMDLLMNQVKSLEKECELCRRESEVLKAENVLLQKQLVDVKKV